jgi:hypothetical protein
MNSKFSLLWACVIFWGLTGHAQIPGFIEQWTVDLGTTNALIVQAIGRDGSSVVQWSSPTNYSFSYIWISPQGQAVSMIPQSEFYPSGISNYLNSFVVVLVLSSNLVVQSQGNNFPMGIPPQGSMAPMLIAQFNLAGGTPQVTKTQFLATTSFAGEFFNDFSCPERLMFVQQGTVLTCYRPAVDIATPLTSLTLTGVSQRGAELLVTSSQGGQLQVQGSTNFTNWQSVTNVQTTPGVNKVVVPASEPSRQFYRGKSQ